MIGFAGLSHLGVVSSIAAAVKGFDVLAFDPGEHALTFPGPSAVAEPGLEQAWAEATARIQLTQSAEKLADCRLLFVSLDVNTDDIGTSDLSHFDNLVRCVIEKAAPGAVVVVLSQVPPGTVRHLLPALAAKRGALYSQVETLIIGRALDRALHPKRFIVGCDKPASELPPVYADYLASFGCPIFRLNYESAELSKIAINTFLASSVSTANLLAEICEPLGADWAAIAETLKLDQRIGPHAYLSPGLGIAGGNLERDLATLRRLTDCHGTDGRLIDAWLADSRYRRDWVLRRLHETALAERDNPVIAVWGLAYKPDTASTRNSPALSLIDALRPITVRAYDPRAVCDRPHVLLSTSPVDACQGADALAILTPWREFVSCPVAHVKAVLRGRTIIDPFRVLDREECSLYGMKHLVLGNSASRKETVA
jgi:UDPglucose 6-dehydrogenase